MIITELKFKIKDALHKKRKMMFLVGAGISAESGIPTFRGFDGFWTVDSKNYTPQEMGTLEMFKQGPIEVWKWYLYRKKLCSKASPNEGHKALLKFEQLLKDKFVLVSQNVDGLHKKVGSSEEKTFLIHGDLKYMRCSEECSDNLYELPNQLLNENFEDKSDRLITEKLVCPKCKKLSRPHVLWFDESYNEKLYKLDTVIEKSKNTEILFIIGTSGATLLPRAIFDLIRKKNGLIINIDPNRNRFTNDLEKYKNGFVINEKSGKGLTTFYKYIKANYSV